MLFRVSVSELKVNHTRTLPTDGHCWHAAVRARETVLFRSPSVGLGERGTVFSQSGAADGHSVWHFKSSSSRPQSPHNELV